MQQLADFFGGATQQLAGNATTDGSAGEQAGDGVYFVPFTKLLCGNLKVSRKAVRTALDAVRGPLNELYDQWEALCVTSRDPLAPPSLNRDTLEAVMRSLAAPEYQGDAGDMALDHIMTELWRCGGRKQFMGSGATWFRGAIQGKFDVDRSRVALFEDFARCISVTGSDRCALEGSVYCRGRTATTVICIADWIGACG